MKNWKRYLALLAAIVLLLGALLPLVFAFAGGENGEALFRGAVAVAFLLPVLLYAMLLPVQYYTKRRRKDMSDAAIDTIIFDVGNVLVDFCWEEFLDSFQFPKEERDAIAKAVFESDAWNLRDKGTVSDEEILKRFIEAAPAYEEDIRILFSRVHETIRKRDYAESWVKYLKAQGYRLYILSNYGETMLSRTRHLIPEKEMDGVIFSCNVKEIKPEPQIYRILLDRYSIDPKRAVFLDDRQENLDTAKTFGIHTILFQDFKQAVRDLEKMGVK